jgi:hypothetical protein
MAEQKMSKLSFHKSSDLFIYLFICGTGIWILSLNLLGKYSAT